MGLCSIWKSTKKNQCLFSGIYLYFYDKVFDDGFMVK